MDSTTNLRDRIELLQTAQEFKVPSEFLIPVTDGYMLLDKYAEEQSKPDVALTPTEAYEYLRETLKSTVTPQKFIQTWVATVPTTQTDIDTFYSTYLNIGADDVDTLISRYEIYKESWASLLEEEVQVLSALLNNPIISSAYTSVISKFKEESCHIMKQFKIEEDLRYIFDNVELSKDVPYARYTDPRNPDNLISFYKFYRGTGTEKVPNYSVEWIQNNKIIKDNRSLIVKIRVNQRDDEQAFTTLYLDWGNDNECNLSLKVPVTNWFNFDIAIDTVNNVLASIPGLDLIVPAIGGIKGLIKVKDYVFDDDVFPYVIMNNPALAPYLSIKETSLKANSNRRPTYIYAEGERMVSFVMEQISSKINEEFINEDGSEEKLAQGSPYTALHIEATDYTVLNNFISVIGKILYYSQQQFAEVFEELQRLIPSYGRVVKSPTSAVNTKNPTRQITVLRNAADELFKNNYARKCQGERQPLVFETEEEAKRFCAENTWQSTDSNGKLVTRNYEYIRFPMYGELPNGKTLYFASYRSEYPYMGVVFNSNSTAPPGWDPEKFYAGQYAPCCFRTSQKQGSTYYVSYYNGDKPNPTKNVKGNVITTHKFLSPGIFGVLPQDIVLYLSSITNTSASQWYRYGVYNSPNSFLHAVCRIRDPEYVKLPQDATLENYVKEIRRNFLSQHAAVCLQELSTLSVDEIENRISDADSYLDTQAYKRLLEAYFNINIVIFTRTDDAPQGEIEIPYYKVLHHHSYLDPRKPTILLFKHEGAEINMIASPQTEIIAYRGGPAEVPSFLANPALVASLNNVLVESYKSVQWYFTPEGKLVKDDEANLVLDLGLYFQSELLQAQYVDEYGKLRYVLYDDIPIVVPSGRPLNLPVVNIDHVAVTSLSETLEKLRPLLTNEDAIYSYNIDTNGMVVGVWWYKDKPSYKTLFFTPCLPSNTLPEFAQMVANYLPYPSLLKTEVDAPNNLVGLEKTKLFLNQILEQTYITSGIPDIDQFVDNFVEVREGHVYQLELLSRTLPEIGQDIPTFFENGQIIAESELLKDKFRVYLDRFVLNNEGMELSIPTYFRDYYHHISDFQKRPGTLLFPNTKQALTWISNLQQYKQLSNIPLTLPENADTYKEPYAINTVYGYFLVQNVFDGDLLTALTVTDNWNSKVINSGYYTKPVENGDNNIVVYNVSSEGKLMTPVGDGNRYVLCYHNRDPANVRNKYAALLYLSSNE